MNLVVLVAMIAFSWGWVTHVAMGNMTTAQYVSKIGRDLYNGIMAMSGNVRTTADRTAGHVRTLHGSAAV